MAAQEQAGDLVTLTLGLPLLLASAWLAFRGSLRGRLLLAGTLGYFLYTYAGAALGYAFATLTPLYILLFSLAAFALGSAVAGLDVASIARQVDDAAPRRAAEFLALIGLMLAALELGQYATYLASGTLPAGVAAAGGGAYFVYGLDLGLVLPLTLLGAYWLWRRRPWGDVLAGAIVIKAATMGAALLAMSWLSLRAGLPTDPAELLGFYGLLTFGGLAMAVWFFRRCRG